MLPKVEENSDWKSKYQAALEELELREREWRDIEALLRKTIGRLSIAGRGHDMRLDKHLREIQGLSRDKCDEKLSLALDKLGEIIRDLDDPQSTGKYRRSDPIMLMLELLQNIHFSDTQRGQLRQICSELLKSVANGHDRDSVSAYIQQLSALINENYDQVVAGPSVAEIVMRLLALLELGEAGRDHISAQFKAVEQYGEDELQALADALNRQFNPNTDDASIDAVMTTLLERLAIVQGADSDAQKLKSRVHQGDKLEDWTGTLNEIVNSISASLKKLDQEKRELENFILNVTEQLGEITRVISEDQKDRQSNQDDAQSLHEIMQQGMSLIQDNFQTANDLQDLKAELSKNIDVIRGGVDNFVVRFQERNEVTEERNHKLTEQLSQMEQETQELQVMLMENREKLMYDALTGAYSRMAYDEQIKQELTRYTRAGAAFSYIIFDIDHFKRINDTFGHNAGDKALKIVAQLMQQNLRKSDYVFRIGGEEFVLTLSNTPEATADSITQKLRDRIAASSFHFKGKPVQLTLSAGITETRPGDSAESIYERADQALYKAKNSGRNCQFIAD